jgi:hypothetical protein
MSLPFLCSDPPGGVKKTAFAKSQGCAMLAALNLCLLNARPSKNVPRCLILTVCGTLLLM